MYLTQLHSNLSPKTLFYLSFLFVNPKTRFLLGSQTRAYTPIFLLKPYFIYLFLFIYLFIFCVNPKTLFVLGSISNPILSIHLSFLCLLVIEITFSCSSGVIMTSSNSPPTAIDKEQVLRFYYVYTHLQKLMLGDYILR